ncbi:hypothetical protein DMN91_007465 [Ooceraea biroi]|uniref:Uncharacterized protein n=1 Tax=Ooceraea biroi TaxID=2015173 RepID=A0A3L8DKF6_OOCBI|nr:hypothetical protein DMN91_007465 [Ooceraea biroi]
MDSCSFKEPDWRPTASQRICEGYMNPHFLPMIDNDVKRPLFPHPIHQLVNDDNDIPIIVDYTSHECLLFLTDSSENHLNMIYEYELPNHVRRVGNLQDPVKISQLTERVKQ